MIPFNKIYLTGNELEYIRQSHENGNLSGDGVFTYKASQWLEAQTQTRKALITHSCTAALEMAALLAEIQPGDEVIMPSYTFVSTANAFVLRGGAPVFVDIRADTLNIDEIYLKPRLSLVHRWILTMRQHSRILMSFFKLLIISTPKILAFYLGYIDEKYVTGELKQLN